MSLFDKTYRVKVRRSSKNTETKRIDLINNRCYQLFKTAAKSLDKAIPVDIVVDLSLMSDEDIQRDIKTWAYLILLCKDLKNVNFIFEDRPELVKGVDLPDHLECQIRKAPDKEKVLGLLRDEIRRAASVFNDDHISELINRRVRSVRSTVEAEDAEPIEIPITSRKLLMWVGRVGRELKDNQYPVALEGLAADRKNAPFFRNFHAALAIGLT